VRLIRFSPDGSLLATAAFDNTARLWSASTGEELAVLRGHESGLHEVSFSPDAGKLATISEDGTMRIWNTRMSAVPPDCVTGQRHRLTFSRYDITHPSGARLVLLRNTPQAVLYSPSSHGVTEEHVLEQSYDVVGGRFSEDGSLLITGSGAGWMGGGEARVYSVSTGELIKVIESKHGQLRGAFFIEGNHSVMLAWEFGHLDVRGVETGEVELEFSGHASTVISVAFSEDKKHLATCSTDQALLVIPEAFDPEGSKLGFSTDGQTVVSIQGSEKARTWPVDIVDAARRRAPRSLTLPEKRAFAVWDPGEEQALTLVEQLFDDLILAADVRDSLQAMVDLDDDVREIALRLTHLHEDNEEMLYNTGIYVRDRFTGRLSYRHIQGPREERGPSLIDAARRLREMATP